MEQQGYSLGNILKNMTKGQKLALGLGLLIVILVIVLLALLGSARSDNNEEEDSGENEQQSVVEDTYTNDEGYTVTRETTTYADGAKVITETKMDEYGNVTTVDPSLITTYFPYQVMRQHDNEEYVELGFEETLRYSLQVDEEAKVISATIEYCDVEGDTALVQQYISSIPLDLSAYTVNYETFSEDAICD